MHRYQEFEDIVSISRLAIGRELDVPKTPWREKATREFSTFITCTTDTHAKAVRYVPTTTNYHKRSGAVPEVQCPQQYLSQVHLSHLQVEPARASKYKTCTQQPPNILTHVHIPAFNTQEVQRGGWGGASQPPSDSNSFHTIANRPIRPVFHPPRTT